MDAALYLLYFFIFIENYCGIQKINTMNKCTFKSTNNPVVYFGFVQFKYSNEKWAEKGDRKENIPRTFLSKKVLRLMKWAH